MDAIPYMDTLFKEYLLFRGFTNTMTAFNQDLSTDRGCGFQAEKISQLIFGKIMPSFDCEQLVDLLDFLNLRQVASLPWHSQECENVHA